MKCNRDYDLVGFFNNESASTERAEIEQHLISCADCQMELSEIRDTVFSFKRMPEIEPASNFNAKVISAIRISKLVRASEPTGVMEVVRYYLRLSPPWAISTAIHLVVFAAFAFVFVTQVPSRPYKTADIVKMWLPKMTEEIVSTKKPPESARYVTAPSLDHKQVPEKILQSNDKVIGHIVQRADPKRREELLARYDGKDTVNAVAGGVKWLAASQESSGNWSASKYGGKDEYNTALTGLAVLCFTAQGNSHLDGEYKDVVDKAARYLVSVQQPNGLLTTPLPQGDSNNYMYNHGIATFALLEDYIVSRNSRTDDEFSRQLLDTVGKAVTFIVQAQSRDGGWGYTSRSSLSDTSVTVWQVQALRLADVLGIQGVEEALYKSSQWLAEVTADNGLVGYQSALDYPNGPRGLTAAGLQTHLLIGSLPALKDNSSAKRLNDLRGKQADFLSENMPNSPTDLYYYYWGTMAVFSSDDPKWPEWNRKIKEVLLKSQAEKGDWQVNDRWSVYGGDLYTTVIAILTLQIYYRYPQST